MRKLFKVWSVHGVKKAVVASSLDGLKRQGCTKLDISVGNTKLYLEDGTELDEDELLDFLPSGTVVYFLHIDDRKPWLSSTFNSSDTVVPATSALGNNENMPTDSEIEKLYLTPSSIYVGNLTVCIQRKDLEKEFKRFGKINRMWVTLKRPGFAYLEFSKIEEANNAIRLMNGSTINGSQILVHFSYNKDNKDKRDTTSCNLHHDLLDHVDYDDELLKDDVDYDDELLNDHVDYDDHINYDYDLTDDIHYDYGLPENNGDSDDYYDAGPTSCRDIDFGDCDSD